MTIIVLGLGNVWEREIRRYDARHVLDLSLASVSFLLISCKSHLSSQYTRLPQCYLSQYSEQTRLKATSILNSSLSLHCWLFLFRLSNLNLMAPQVRRVCCFYSFLGSRPHFPYLERANDCGEYATAKPEGTRRRGTQSSLRRLAREKRRMKREWDEEWGKIGKEGNLWWLGSGEKGWVDVMGSNPLGWFLPIGQSLNDGMTYPVNPRFDEQGRWRRRIEWPKELQ